MAHCTHTHTHTLLPIPIIPCHPNPRNKQSSVYVGERQIIRINQSITIKKIEKNVNRMDAIRVENVACMSKESNNIPWEFIRAETEQPGMTTVRGVKLEVPTIDFSQQEEELLMDQIIEASRDWGMYQIVNHGIPSDVIANLQAVGKAFFDLPQQQKELIAKLPGSVEGYGTLLHKDIQIQGKKGWVDHLFHRVWPPSAINYRFWPTHPPSYREANEEYVKELHGVIDKLLKSIGKGIGMEGQEVRDALGGDKLEYLMKINYYPPCPRPDLALGVPPHTDMSAITILVPNHVQGLQAFRDGHWYDVNYIPNALVIHIGDQIEILSNGKYKAVLHRTTVCDETRMSWPLFLEPPANQMVGPHPKLIDHQNPPKFKTKTFGDYAYCKFNKIPQ